MIRSSARIRVDAPPRAVVEFIADPANAPRWMKALEVSEPLTPGPIRPGSRFREVQSAGRPAHRVAEAELAIMAAVESLRGPGTAPVRGPDPGDRT